jgi:hypothetical protein
MTDYFEQLNRLEQEAAETEDDAEFQRVRKANIERRRIASLPNNHPDALDFGE